MNMTKFWHAKTNIEVLRIIPIPIDYPINHSKCENQWNRSSETASAE